MPKKIKKKAIAEAEAVVVQARITSKDDSVILGTIDIASFNLVTEYGTLELPVKNVSGIRMGVTPIDDEGGKPVDVIEINNNYSIGGQSNIKTVDVITAFGNLSIPADRIERMDLYTISGGQSTFKLLASKHISSNVSGGWLNTGLMIKKGKAFSIVSSGQVVLASLSGAKYSPDGSTPGATVPNTGQAGTDTAYPNYGSVVYKIGENGPMLKAGNKFSGTASSTGTLYLSIYEAVYNPGNTGTYIVKVKRK